jgi:signal transduction histidine kinase
VRVDLSAEPDVIALAIEDDGPGMTPAQIAAFGQRREQRIQAGASSSLSLGLGSVIIRTIVDLHGGRLSLQGDAAGPDAGGTRLTVRLPRSA